MANFFPAGSRADVEQTPSYLRRTSSRRVLREASDDRDSPSDSRMGRRPSHINWKQNSSATTQAGRPKPPQGSPSVRLGRSASLSALPAPPPSLRRQSSLVSHHSLQLDKLARSRTDSTNAASAHPTAKQLSPISEQSYVPTPKQLCPTDVEPGTPVSVGSTYSAFLRRPLKRSISATSTSSLRTNATATHPPILPPLNIPPLDIRPIYPPVSHRAGAQLISTVYEDTASERTGSFVTAPSLAGDAEDAETTLLHSSAALPSSGTDQLADPDRITEGTTLAATATPPYGGSSTNGGVGGGVDVDGSSNSDAEPRAPRPRPRPRPRKHEPASGGSGGTSDTFIWRRWTRGLSFGSALSRPSFTSAARRAHSALLARLPPLPVMLFWAGFLAPWCWLIGGWLIAEGRWESSGRARSALPLWKPRRDNKGKGKGKGKDKAAAVGGPHDPAAGGRKGTDVEKGGEADTTTTTKEVAGGGGERRERAGADRPHRRPGCGWAPPWNSFAWLCAVPGASSPDGAARKEKVVTFVEPYDAEVWVYRCRLAAVVSALMLLTAFVVTLVVVGGSSTR